MSEAVPKHDQLIVIGHWNAKVGQAEEREVTTIGKYPLSGGVRNDNGERFVNFCAMNDLLITSTVFPHKDIHKYTWTSPVKQWRKTVNKEREHLGFKTWRQAAEVAARDKVA